jgi:16S rRNA (guanine527-N7)-methyltransferase
VTPEEFRAATGVSRETVDRLGAYLALIGKWQRAINLVAAASLKDAWRRHLLDSAQLYPLIPPTAATLVDLGSGAGLPGLVLAILAQGEGRVLAVNLVESDGRKAAFLATAARELGLVGVTVHASRAEDLAATGRLHAEIVTARALAPLERLLALARPFLVPGGRCLFLKGERVDDELTAAQQSWRIRVDRIPSRSDPAGVVLAVAIEEP